SRPGRLPRKALSQRRNQLLAEDRLRTLGFPLALLVQAQGGAAPQGAGTSIISLIAGLGPVAQLVLLTLAVLSVISWSIILQKLWTFQRSARQTSQFLDVFRRSQKFSEVQAVCKSVSHSPLVGLFQSGYTELTAQ